MFHLPHSCIERLSSIPPPFASLRFDAQQLGLLRSSVVELGLRIGKEKFASIGSIEEDGEWLEIARGGGGGGTAQPEEELLIGVCLHDACHPKLDPTCMVS